MTATLTNPVYTVYAISGNKKYILTPALVSLDRSEADNQIAQRVTLHLTNVLVDGIWLSSILHARDRVYVYANDGSTTAEVFRGYVWSRNYKSSLNDRDLTYTCYDNLIYFQESEESLYFSDGKSTEDVFTSICDKWGIQLNYSYESITHSKLPLRGTLSSIFTEDLLDPVKKRTGKKYVILSDRDTMFVKNVGVNETIYHFLAGNNVIKTSSGWTMDGIVTQIVIVGKADDDDREPIEATVSGDTAKYGTLQKIQSRDEDTSLADAKQEAQVTIDESGTPKNEYELTAPDIPWIRKGDKVYVDAGDINESYLIVTAIDRSADSKNVTMTLTMEDV